MTKRNQHVFLALVLAAAALVNSGSLRAACSEGNIVDTLSSNLADFPTGLDFSSVAAAGARERSGGTRLYVYLSNANFSLSQMSSSMVSPIKDRSQGVLILKLSNGQDQVKPGDYSPSAGYGAPYFASAELRRMKSDGKAVDLVFNLEEGSISLLQLADGSACGTFHLSGIGETRISGSFRVPVD